MNPKNETLEMRCPLCKSSEATEISAIAYEEIWSNLQTEWGAAFSDAMISAYTPSPFVKLQQCRECQLQYFYPAVLGDADFYAALTSSCSRYYSGNKWEFDFIKDYLNQNHKVLDLACGKGAFLSSIIGIVNNASGIDTNPDAVADCHLSGLSVQSVSIERYSSQHEEEFDVVTAFQVVEHLDDIMSFLHAAYLCVKPGGLLVFSVPNRNRRKGTEFGSLDYPPHHASRWGQDQIAVVAEQLNAKLFLVAKQPLDKSQTIGALRLKELPALFPYHFTGRDFLFKVLSRMAMIYPLGLIWRNSIVNKWLDMYGLSMMAILQKPVRD